MTNTQTPTPPPVLVTLDITDDDVYAVLVNALREAASVAHHDAAHAAQNEERTEDQEYAAQIALDLVESIETQVDALSAARIQQTPETDTGS